MKLLSTVLLAGTVLTTPALAETITLSPGDSVQAAIDRARPGDTIALRAGTYNQSLDFSNKHGAAGAPIRLVSADGKGAARVVAQGNRAAIQGNRLSHITVDGLNIVSTSRSGDTGGIKFWGSYQKLHDVTITNNLVTGVGQDGIKIFNMAPGDGRVVVAGNTIDGNWRQEGIDNVSVVDVTYQGNTIKGRAGFAGITWKAGSDGVRFINNTVDIAADTAVSVGGYGDSRLGRLGSFPDEFQDNEAENSVVTGNDIRGDVRVISAENNRIEGNSISGSISNGRNSDMPGSIASRNNAIADNRVTGGTGTAAWNGTTDSQFDRNVDGLQRNVLDTDEQFWRAVERGETGALRRLNDLVSGGIVAREGNRIINRATGQMISTVNSTIGEAVDTVLQPVEDTVSGVVEAVKCNIGGSIMGGGASIVSGIFGGGRATLPAQIAQQMTMIAGNLCLSRQLAVQQRQLQAQLKHLQPSQVDTGADIQGAMMRQRSLIGETEVYDTDEAPGIYQDLYPDDMDGLSTEELFAKPEQWRNAAHRATEESWRVQSGAVEAQSASQVRVGRQLGAVRSAPGMLAAQQGTAQLIGSLIGETQTLQSVSISHFRAVEHSMAQEQAKAKRAEELHRRAMQGLSGNDAVNVRSPF
ncbi:hypothetical protein IGS68_01095 [Skermanella sp. TT6]|uniref:Right handed beta helix domain-containing protein n=1 Tax=Skermanella cutis TaxID=2775420 RepID=A0ABX7B6A4_9PROT|nr:hypothetical protein [Skermanella sp. TT6]QQP89906.1 hypothetical protein IGS68_01095 [Skermanella sp. TT6]